MKSSDQNQLTRWQRDRRAFIEHRIYWHGSIGLADLMDVMEISRAQASKDLNGYITDHPNHLRYDKSARTYVMGDAFQAHYLEIDAAEHLADLAAIAKGAAVPKSDWVVDLPDVLDAAIPARSLNPSTVRSVLMACAQRERSQSPIGLCRRPILSSAQSLLTGWLTTVFAGTREHGAPAMIFLRTSYWLAY